MNKNGKQAQLNDYDCEICFNLMTAQNYPCVLKCGHSICHNCISSISNNKCPFCKMSFDGRPTKNFYLLNKITESSNSSVSRDQNNYENQIKSQSSSNIFLKRNEGINRILSQSNHNLTSINNSNRVNNSTINAYNICYNSTDRVGNEIKSNFLNEQPNRINYYEQTNQRNQTNQSNQTNQTNQFNQFNQFITRASNQYSRYFTSIKLLFGYLWIFIWLFVSLLLEIKDIVVSIIKLIFFIVMSVFRIIYWVFKKLVELDRFFTERPVRRN